MAAVPVKSRIGLALSGGATRGLTHIDIIYILFNAFDIAIDENTKAQVRDADVLIEPRLSDFPRMDTSQIDALIAGGYRAAKERINRIRAVLK